MSITASKLPRVLCVDDDPQVLLTHIRSLEKNFVVETAANPELATRLMMNADPFAVVISDMQMPGMDGVTFLAQVRQRNPETTRILVTGAGDLDVAVKAINRGQIFRFLKKPSVPEELLAVTMEGVEQFRLVTAEKVLLEQTLAGSIRALSELLSLVNPRVFEHANRAQENARLLATAVGASDAWSIEVSAVLLQLATLTMPTEMLDKLLSVQPLNSKEQAILERCPEVAERLISHIPRLEKVQQCLLHCSRRFSGNGKLSDASAAEEIPVGARIVKVATDFSILVGSGLSIAAALDLMTGRKGDYDPAILTALRASKGDSIAEASVLLELSLSEVRPGMELRQEVRTTDGIVIVAAGISLTGPLIARLNNFAASAGVREPLLVSTARSL